MQASEIPIKAVNRLLVQAIQEADPLPGYPEFDGEPLTLARLEDGDAWPNNGRRRKARRVWGRFVSEVNEVTARRNERIFRLLMTQGVDLDAPPLAEWGAGGDLDLAELGIEDGTVSPMTRKLLYIHHLLPDADQKLEILVRIMEASGLEKSAVGTVQALFREALGAVQNMEGNHGGER